MKKLFLTLAIALMLCLTGCEKVEETKKGSYKEGTYMGFIEYVSYEVKYVTTATIYVDEDGFIKSCYLDSTYVKDGVNTTKKVLGDEYGMKATSANIGTIEGGAEWYEQVKVIEDKVVSEQNLNWVKWSNEEETNLDSISGVTITSDTYIKAIEKALSQAK